MISKAIKNGLQTGLIFAVIIIFMMLIGFMATGSALVSKLLGTQVSQVGLPDIENLVIFVCLIGISAGLTASRREGKSLSSSILSGFASGLMSGILSAIVAFILGDIYKNGADLRIYLSELSPQDVRFLNFNIAPLTGSAILLALLSISGLVGGLISKAFRSEKRRKASHDLSNFWTTLKNKSTIQIVSGNKWTRYGLLGLVFIVLALLPTQWGSYWNYVMGTVGIYVILGLGLNIIVGLSGQLVLGYVAYFAVGAYTIALLNAPHPHNLMWGFWIGLAAAIALATITGILIGLPLLNLRGDYLAIVTLGFGEIIHVLLLSDALSSLTGGPRGVLGIPGPEIFGIQFSSDVDFMYLILLAILITIFITQRVQNSSTGRSWISIREDETVARATGVNTFSSKLLALALGAAFAGVGGALFAVRSQSTGPDDYTLMVSINVLCLVIVGGMGSIPGIILGSFVLKGLPELLRDLDNYRMLVFGALLIVMMIIRPEGIWPAKRRIVEKYQIDAKTNESIDQEGIPAGSAEELSTGKGETP